MTGSWFYASVACAAPPPKHFCSMLSWSYLCMVAKSLSNGYIYIIKLKATWDTRPRARDHSTSSTLIGGKGGAGPSSLLHTTLEGPTEYVSECKMDVKSTWIKWPAAYWLKWLGVVTLVPNEEKFPCMHGCEDQAVKEGWERQGLAEWRCDLAWDLDQIITYECTSYSSQLEPSNQTPLKISNQKPQNIYYTKHCI